jgi:hypothetical protein
LLTEEEYGKVHLVSNFERNGNAMSVMVKATAIRPELFGDVVDMPTKELFIVKTSQGFFTVQDSEIKEFFI